MTKPACLSLSILELAKIVMYEFWYDYIKPGYEKKKKTKTKLCYIYVDIAQDFEAKFNSSKYELEIPLPKGKR